MAEKKQLPDFFFLGGAELASSGAKGRGLAEKVPELSALEDQQLATCDRLQQPGGKMENLVRNKFGTFKSIHHALTLSQR
jgi:hypothetical protein